MDNDLTRPIVDLYQQYEASLVDLLVVIQDLQSTNHKSWARLKQQKYLSDSRTRSSTTARSRVPSLHWASRIGYAADNQYLAVSYTWNLSRHEHESGHTHVIQHILSGNVEKSGVRDSVLERVTKFAGHHNILGFWIDRDCIDQNDQDKKRVAMQSMDMVYRFNHDSVALLSVPILDQVDLDLLARLMRGKFVIQVGPQHILKLRRFVRVWKARQLIRLLVVLLADSWWTRAWTYHEEFCASRHMTVLIPHSSDLVKRDGTVLGNITDEVSISAVDFRSRVTEFCLAHQRKQGDRWRDGSRQCAAVLKIAPSYRVLEQHTRLSGPDQSIPSLSTKVVAEITSRQITRPEDILPILANCNGYAVRLDAEILVARKASLSAAVLALCLLNGEILRNDMIVPATDQLNVAQMISEHFVRFHDVPRNEKRLTFLKRCRFVAVRLCREGIQTRGMVWLLQRPPVRGSRGQPFPIELTSKPLTLREQLALSRFADSLRPGQPGLATAMQRYLDDDLDPNEYPSERVDFLNIMARRLLLALQKDETVWIGAPTDGPRDAHGIFVDVEDDRSLFTAWLGRDRSRPDNVNRYLEKHVSLGVDVTSLRHRGLLCLRTRRWTNGLCFFRVDDQRDVLFPWPKGFDRL